MAETPNHGYNVPDPGTEDWHDPLNENFETFDVDIELREGGEPDTAEFEPVEGAKYFDTENGDIYIGDGSEWTLLGGLNGNGDNGNGESNWEEDEDETLLKPTADAITGVKIDRIRSPADAAVSIETDGGEQALTLGIPSEADGVGFKAGGNVVAGSPENDVLDGAVGVTIGGGGAGGDAINLASADFATVAGGYNNTATATRTTISGGFGNIASGEFATIAGGESNNASDAHAAVGGGFENEANGEIATIGGGRGNEASNLRSTVGGGVFNEASGVQATVAGGGGNRAIAVQTSVAGGGNNTAETDHATVGGGENNVAGDEDDDEVTHATVGGGINNTASGSGSTVPGGDNNTADGNYSMAVGREAKAEHDGAMVFGDSSDTEVESENEDEARFQMEIVAEEGVSDQSARAAKTNVSPVDTQAVLSGVECLEVAEWEYKNNDGEGNGRRHIGPMAEEFCEAFNIGTGTTINSIDRAGVALAAIQALSENVDETREELAQRDERIDQQADRIESLKAENEQLREENEQLRRRVAAIEAELGIDTTETATPDN